MLDPAPSRSIAHADGVYLDLPMSDYLRDRALSGSAFKKLLSNPPDWWWDHPQNPLWHEAQSDARALGTLVHCAILEGIETYESRYFVAPDPDAIENVMRTADDMKAWLKAHDQKVSGTKAELIDRIQGHWAVLNLGGHCGEDEPIFWDAFFEREARGREQVKAEADRYVRLVERFVRTDEAYAPLLDDGLAEVSIFWTEGDIRYKARLDFLNAAGVLDLKKFGQPPMMGRSLLQHVLREAAVYGYDVQAVHNYRAASRIADLMRANCEIVATGSGALDRIERLVQIATALDTAPCGFCWLFVRTPGAPCAIAPRFEPRDRHGNTNLVWDAAERKIETAVERFREYRALCGDEMWLRSDGEVIPDIADWPMWTTEIASA